MTSYTTTVLYHANCLDGFGAAFAAWLKLRDRATYIPVNYSNPPPNLEPCDRLYILDFSYPADTLRELVSSGVAKQVVVLDHHKTAEADLRDLSSIVELIGSPDKPGIYTHFDMEESGSTLSWLFFGNYPWMLMPDFFRYLRDRDLWKWEMDRSKEFSAALASYPQEFDVWETFLGSQEAIRRLKNEGEALLRSQKQRVMKMCQNALWMRIAGHTVPCVNTASDISEVGEYLGEQFPHAPFSASFTVLSSEKAKWSLRSRGGFDVSEVAKKFGGGGHKAAAGFTSTWRMEGCNE
jgi:uncharacterized protein